MTNKDITQVINNINLELQDVNSKYYSKVKEIDKYIHITKHLAFAKYKTVYNVNYELIYNTLGYHYLKGDSYWLYDFEKKLDENNNPIIQIKIL